MILLEDTRNQVGKHDKKNEYFYKNGIEVRRTKLYCGDYTLPTNQSVCIDTKKDIQELIGDICGKSHERFRNEIMGEDVTLCKVSKGGKDIKNAIDSGVELAVKSL